MFSVFSYNLGTCANNRHKCSQFADCKDYSSGYCCHCRPGFYGNGIQCVAEGNIRLHHQVCCFRGDRSVYGYILQFLVGMYSKFVVTTFEIQANVDFLFLKVYYSCDYMFSSSVGLFVLWPALMVWFIFAGKPQRTNGKIHGKVYVGDSPSPVEFTGNDLHSYVVVNDGRTYVAISDIPHNLGPSLQPLVPLGGVIGWAFALEQPGYKNGFSIIGKGKISTSVQAMFDNQFSI